MSYLEWLQEVVVAKLSEKPIGEVVALRAHFQLTADHGLLVPFLAGSLDATMRWFKDAPVALYGGGGAEAGYVSLLAKFASGKTAVIVSETVQADQSPHLNMLLIGNRGTLQFDDDLIHSGAHLDFNPPRSSEVVVLSELVQQTLTKGQPVAVRL